MNLLTLASALAIPVAALSLPASFAANFGSTPAQPTIFAQTTRAEDSHFTLTNSSSSPIVGFYVEAANRSLTKVLLIKFLGILPVRCDFCKESNERIGSENILAQPLQPEESRRITIAAGTTCLSNIKVVFANRTSRGHENVDVCNLGGITHGN